MYTFAVEVETNTRLWLSAGNGAGFLTNAIMIVDEEGLLCPGVSVPGIGERLLGIRLEATGAARTDAPLQGDCAPGSCTLRDRDSSNSSARCSCQAAAAISALSR